MTQYETGFQARLKNGPETAFRPVTDHAWNIRDVLTKRPYDAHKAAKRFAAMLSEQDEDFEEMLLTHGAEIEVRDQQGTRSSFAVSGYVQLNFSADLLDTQEHAFSEAAA